MENFKSIRIVEHDQKTTVSVQLTGGNATVSLAKNMNPQSVAHCLRHLALLLEQGADHRALGGRAKRSSRDDDAPES